MERKATPDFRSTVFKTSWQLPATLLSTCSEIATLCLGPKKTKWISLPKKTSCKLVTSNNSMSKCKRNHPRSQMGLSETPKWPCGGDMILVQWIQGVPSFSDKPQCEKIPETVALLKHRNPKKVKRQQSIAQLGTCSRQSTSAATESEGPDDTSIKQSGHLGTFFTVHLSHLAWIELIS